MPDIGLLGGPPRPRLVPAPPPEAAAGPAPSRTMARAAAAEFAILRAPADEASTIIVQSPEPVVSEPVLVAAGVTSLTPPPGFEGDPLEPPRATAVSGPPPIRWQDLAWLALALVLIIGTGLGIRDPWPADEPRFALVARDMVLSGE